LGLVGHIRYCEASIITLDGQALQHLFAGYTPAALFGFYGSVTSSDHGGV